MARRIALLACETGTGRGHVVTLAGVAQALAGRWECVAGLSRLEYAAALSLHARAVHQAPVMARRPDAEVLAPRPAPLPPRTVPDLGGRPVLWADSWANWIGRRGFRDVARLRAQVAFWRDMIWKTGATLVAVDYAPSALLAARALGVPSVVTGTAIGIAPVRMPRFPELSPAPGGVLIDEDETAALISEAVAPLGGPPLARLAELYTATLALPRGFPAWDPYSDWRDEALLLPVEEHPPRSDGRGTAIFAYLSTTEFQEPAIVDALRRVPFPVTMFAPGLPASQAQALRDANPRLMISPVPLPMGDIVRQARLMLNAGQAGIAAVSMLAGIPMLALPQHNEHAANARGAARLGGHRVLHRNERSAGAILRVLSEMWEDPALALRAQVVADDLRRATPLGALEATRRALGRF
ncbi:MAG: hypothetical protein KDK12_18920 [Rhodobacteraceae bacterium]|nr:hypothetical protein [Paracoccaceae bacterium]